MEQIQQQLTELQQAVATADARAASAERRAAVTEASLPSMTLLLSSLNQLPAAIQSAASSAGAAAPTVQHRSLVDVRGLGKPPLFNNVEAGYMMWSRKVESYVGSTYPQCRNILTRCSEKSTAVLIDDV